MSRPPLSLPLTILVTACLSTLLVTGLSAQQAESTKGVALVVGNAAYQKVKPLANPGNDAEDVAGVLTGLGWDVTVVKDADLKRFRGAVQAFSRKLEGQKAGLFYYAGHGIQAGGVNYLVPVDAEIALEADYPLATLPADYVLGAMEESKVPLKLMILDACRDNPFAKARSAGGPRGLVPVQTSAKGTILVYATAPNDVSQDGSGRNGVFTSAFLTNLKTPGVDFQEIFDRTAQAVTLATGGSQNPWMNKSFYGKLYFVSPEEAQRLADDRLTVLKAEQDKLALEMADRTKALAGAKTQGEKDRLELEQKKAQAVAAAQTEEQAALERTKVLAGQRAEEEAKNRAAQVKRTQDAEAQLVALRQQVETQRKATESGSADADDPVAAIARLKALDAAIAEVKKQFDASLAKRLDESVKAWQTRTTLIGQYTKDPWENKAEFEARKADAAGLAARDKDNEVAGLKDSFAQSYARESAALVAQRDGVRATLTTKDWPLPAQGLTLTRGVFNEDTKVWPLHLVSTSPAVVQDLEYKLEYKTPAELKKAYTDFEALWKAGALVVQATMRVAPAPWEGYWQASLSRFDVVDLTKGNRVVVSGKAGAALGWVGAAPPAVPVTVSVPRSATVWAGGKKVLDLKGDLFSNKGLTGTWTTDQFGSVALEARYENGNVEPLSVSLAPEKPAAAAFQWKAGMALVTMTVTVPRAAELWYEGKKLADLEKGQSWQWMTADQGKRSLEARYKSVFNGEIEKIAVTLKPGEKVTLPFQWAELVFEMVRVQGGTFTMGSPAGEAGRESWDKGSEKQHLVTVGSFSIGAFDVTVGDFRAFVGATGYRTSADLDGGAYWLSGMEWKKDPSKTWADPGFSQGDKNPVVGVSWYDAVAYANWASTRNGLKPAYSRGGSTDVQTWPSGWNTKTNNDITCDFSATGYRLPTEAEWEYAARGGSGGSYTLYAGGNDIDAVAWYGRKGGDHTYPVGQKTANGLGLYDMSGNVWQWCWDWYQTDNTVGTSDPRGPGTGGNRVLRGGSWDVIATNVRVASRYYNVPWNRNTRYGFRLVTSQIPGAR